MLSAARLVGAKDGVTASLRKWEVGRGWRTEWRDSQPACSGSVEKSIPCSEQPSRAHPVFQARGAHRSDDGIVDIRALDYCFKALTSQGASRAGNSRVVLCGLRSGRVVSVTGELVEK